MYSRPPIREESEIKVYAQKDYYWGLVDRENMRDFLALARSVGYMAAREQFTFEVARPDKLHQYIDSPDRADFHFLLPLDKDAQILDLGSGYGNITIPLARHYHKVVAVDTSRELLEFVKLRSESEGLSNIEFVHADPFEYVNLPFNDDAFDAVVVSGVLEWVGAAKLDENPQTLQEKFLMQVRRFLKDSGFLYLAIENRLFPGYISRDPHSKLHYTAMLPRIIAHWYARRHGFADGYRTYIYSFFGFKRLLRAAGFPRSLFLFPFPSYRSPLIIWPNRHAAAMYLLNGPLGEKLYTQKWRRLIRICEVLHCSGLFLSSFMIIASLLEIRKPASIVYMATSISSAVRLDDYAFKVPDDKFARDCAKFLLFHTGEADPYASVLVPRSPSASERIQLTLLSEYGK